MKSLILPLGTLFALSVPALAQNDIVYTSRADFNAATQSRSVITFEDVNVPPSGFITHTNPFTLDAVTFHATSDSHFNVNNSTYYSSMDPTNIAPYDSGNYLLTALNSPGTTDDATVTFPSSTAFGFDFGGLFGPSFISVTLSDGFSLNDLSLFSSVTGTSSLDFVGFTTSSLITSAQLVMPDGPNYSALDNVTYGAAVAPEPSSIAFVLTGLATTAATLRRRFIR